MQADNHEHSDKPKDWWVAETRIISAGAISRYSRWVGSLKLILPIAAACILMVLVVLPNVNGSNVQPKQLSATDASMLSPVYTSHDAQNRPYEVTADTAKQKPEAAGVTDLANPKAVIDLENGAKLNAEGQGAIYNENDGSLNVQKGVVLRHSNGTTFTTEEAHIDVNSKNAEGNKPVTLQGNFGEVHGQGFKAIDGGKTIIFTGHSTATLKMGQGKVNDGKPTDAKPSDEKAKDGGLPLSSNKAQNAKPATPLAPPQH
ncbi:MAG: LPS export ABC transporter periplasmic protein LptC [Alphaproteobacteria bacterium]|nr:LPS export ABC transporter periplasmic protein LptC [Alphaproteobacteria bacterium]